MMSLEEKVTSVIRVSRDEVQSVVEDYMLDVDVLCDIGVGIRPQTAIVPSIYLAIEPYLPYIQQLQKNLGDDRRFVFLNATWEEGLKVLPPKSVDSVFAFDIIEHLEKEDGLRLLREAERVARRQIVIFTPWGFFPQSYEPGDDVDRWGMGGTHWQTHRSGWLPEDFGDGWLIVGCEDFHLVDHNDKQLEKPFGALWAFKNLDGSVPDAKAKINRGTPEQRGQIFFRAKSLLSGALSPAAYKKLRRYWHNIRHS